MDKLAQKVYQYKGSKYHSKGEYEIAKFLHEMNIDFEYEFPLAVVDGGRVKIWYPDFYLKEYQIVIEYFGMYNYNEGYRESTEHKKSVFKECGIQFLPIYQLNKNWKEYTLKTILQHLEYKTLKMGQTLEKLEKKGSKITTIMKSILKIDSKPQKKGPQPKKKPQQPKSKTKK